MKQFLILILPLLLNSFKTQAGEVLIQSEPIDHPELILYNIDFEDYTTYQHAFEDSLTAFFSALETGYDVKIFQTLDANLYPYYAFTAKPAFPDSLRHALQKKLMSVKPITTYYLPFSTLFILNANGGCKKRGVDYSPQLEKPQESRLRPYAVLNLNDRYLLLEKWINEEALPLISAMLEGNKTEPTGSHRAQKKGIPTQWTKALENSQLMIQENLPFKDNPQLTPALKMMLLGAQGRFDYAQCYMRMIYQFETEKTLIRYILDQFNNRLRYYLAEEQRLIKTAETLNLTEKDLFLDSLNQINPASINLLYARIDKDRSPFVSTNPPNERAIRDQFLNVNPMRSLVLNPLSKKDAYSNALRLEAADYFIDPETFDADFERYAEVALKLEAYEFAADLYWMLDQAAAKNPDQTKKTDYGLYHRYALSKIRTRDTEKTNKADHKAFKKMDKQLQRQMKKNAAYKNFKLAP